MKEVKVIIGFKKGKVNVSNQVPAAVKHVVTVDHVHRHINAITAHVPVDKIGKIKADPDVAYVEYDQVATILGFPVPLVEGMVEQVPWGITKIKATEVHAMGNRGAGIKVCIIDTGIDYNHPDLKDNYKGGHNFVANTTDPKDDHGHGTHVAGTIAAIGNNDIGVIGVAPEAYIYAYKVLNSSGSGSYSNIVAAINKAIDNGMQVISMSLGGSSFSQALKDACDAAYNAGIIIMAAAGNSGGDGSQDNIGYPAKYDSCVAITATDSNDNRASFSSTGPKAEIAAPGVGVLSTVPSGSCSMCDPSGYRNANGTSMATPHMSGVCALVLKANPGMTNVQLRQVLQQAVIDLGQQGRDVFYGYGRIDAKAAVGQNPPPPPVKYKCSGAPNYACTEDPTGPYNSIEECQAQCMENPPPPPMKYRCTGSPDYQCVEDVNGQYATIEACQAACQVPPPPVKKYRCQAKLSWECVESKFGTYKSKEECQAVCSLKNKMQQEVANFGGCCS